MAILVDSTIDLLFRSSKLVVRRGLDNNWLYCTVVIDSRDESGVCRNELEEERKSL